MSCFLCCAPTPDSRAQCPPPGRTPVGQCLPKSCGRDCLGRKGKATFLVKAGGWRAELPAAWLDALRAQCASASYHLPRF